MKLTQSEIIQLLRRRANLTQGDLGARAFNTSTESGRTKVKNIEIGKQRPTAGDLQRLAQVLGVDMDELIPELSSDGAMDRHDLNELIIAPRILKQFPEVVSYLDMLNKATTIHDHELIRYLANKIAAVFSKLSLEVAESEQ